MDMDDLRDKLEDLRTYIFSNTVQDGELDNYRDTLVFCRDWFSEEIEEHLRVD